MTDDSYPDTVINGVPVVATPAEIDITTADHLRIALLNTIRDSHPVVVVDMTSASFCDSAGVQALVAAHKRAQGEGSELRLVIPVGGTVARIFTLTGIDSLVPCFTHLEQALASTPHGAGP